MLWLLGCCATGRAVVANKCCMHPSGTCMNRNTSVHHTQSAYTSCHTMGAYSSAIHKNVIARNTDQACPSAFQGCTELSELTLSSMNERVLFADDKEQGRLQTALLTEQSARATHTGRGDQATVTHVWCTPPPYPYRRLCGVCAGVHD